jgi:4-carboxymuconolactone decarboxylase
MTIHRQSLEHSKDIFMTLTNVPSSAATIGRRAMNEAAPGVPDMVDASLAALSPNTARRIYEQIWGDIYQDPSLSLRDRTLATIAGLTVLGGAESNLTLQINIALNAGMTSVEIVAVIEHAATIAGFPRAQAALTTAAGVFGQRGVDARVV